MDESVSSLLKTILRDSLPIRSVRVSIESLSTKDWNEFARIFALIGFIIQVISVAIIGFVFVIRDVLFATTVFDGIVLLSSRIIPVSIILYVGTWLISPPIDEITGEKETQTNFEDTSPYQVAILGSAWASFAFIWRYAIYTTNFDLLSGSVGFSVGTVIGLVLADSIYFGGLMTGFGSVAQAYFWEKSR